MANNSYTKTYADGAALTEAKLDTAYQTLQMDLAQSGQMTTGATAGQVLTVGTPGSAAVWGTPSDPKTASLARNYGLAASTSSGTLIVSLKSAAGTAPSASDAVTIDFSSNGLASGVPQRFTQTASLSLSITASATLGIRSATTGTLYVYAIRQSSSALKIGLSTNGYLDTGAAQTTVTMSASSDSENVLYSNASVGTYPIRLLGWITASHTTGTWNAIYKVNITNNSSSLFKPWTPVFVPGSSLVVSSTVISVARYTITSKMCHFYASFSLKFSSGSGGFVTMSLPMDPNTLVNASSLNTSIGHGTFNAGSPSALHLYSSSGANVAIAKYDFATYATGITTQFFVKGSYEL